VRNVVCLRKRRFFRIGEAPFSFGLDWSGLGGISVAAVTATYGSALTAGHFRKARKPAQSKVTKALLPHHLVPRIGSACPNAGIAPWAAAKGHPWPSAATSASMPRCPLRNTCVRPSWLTGRQNLRPPRGGLTAGLALAGVHPSDLLSISCGSKACSRGGLIADLLLRGDSIQLWERACSRKRRVSLRGCWMCRCHREQARSHMSLRVFTASANDTKNCGSEPARDSGGSAA